MCLEFRNFQPTSFVLQGDRRNRKVSLRDGISKSEIPASVIDQWDRYRSWPRRKKLFNVRVNVCVCVCVVG